MMSRSEELWITKSFQGANAQDDLFASFFGSLDLPIKVIREKCARFWLDPIPISPQANDLKWILQQGLQGGTLVQSEGIRLERTEADTQHR